MQIPTFILESDELEVLTSVIECWCQANRIEPESACARAVIAIAFELLEAGYRTRESRSIALANALAPAALHE